MALGQEESIGFLMAECPMSHLVLLTLAPNVATTAGPNCFIILLLFLFLLSTPQRELFFQEENVFYSCWGIQYMLGKQISS